MKNKRRITGIVAATILALIGTVALVSYVQSAKDEVLAQEALVDVYVVNELVPKGAAPETIKSAVSIEQVPARLKQTGAITDLETVGDQVAGADLQPGDQLLAARLASRDLVVAEITDKVQISARLDAERAVGGSLQKGDLVGVYLSFDPFELDESGQSTEPADDEDAASADGSAGDDDAAAGAGSGDESSTEGPDKTPNVTRLEFQHVLVTNVQTVSAPVRSDENGDDESAIAQVTGNQYVVTLALSPEQSERFVFASEFGHVWLSIEPASVTDDGTRVVTLGNVYQVVN
jgi:pilus assembly protein CpaB